MSYASNPNVIAQANQIADQMAGEYAASQVMQQEVELNDGPSFLERIRESRLGRAMMMGGAVVAPAGAGFVGLAEAPVAASAATPSLEQECAKDILAQPEILQANMKKPGQVSQSITVKVLFGSVNPACNPRYRRLASARPQIEDSKHPNRWINEDGRDWDTIYYSGNKAGAGGHVSVNTYRKEKLYYKPGSGAEVRFKLRLQEKDMKTGKIVRTKIKNYPIDVKG